MTAFGFRARLLIVRLLRPSGAGSGLPHWLHTVLLLVLPTGCALQKLDRVLPHRLPCKLAGGSLGELQIKAMWEAEG